MSFDAIVFLFQRRYFDALALYFSAPPFSAEPSLTYQYALLETKRQASLLIGFGCDKV